MGETMRIQSPSRHSFVYHILVFALFALLFLTGFAIVNAYTSTAKAEALLSQVSIEPVVEKTQAAPAVQPVIASQSKQEVAVTAALSPTPTPVALATPAPAVDRVIIPSIGLNSQYVSVGLTSNGAIDVHPTLVGVWNGSAQPGSTGAAFFDGHTPGVLTPLTGISVGSTITVQKADGQSFTYTVVYRETIALSAVDMRKALTVYGGSSEGLNIMTCAGTYIPSMRTTDQRLIVYAVRS
jgi:sortase (surface protein transpeptidase)